MPRPPKNCIPMPPFETSSFADTDKMFIKLSKSASRYEGPLSVCSPKEDTDNEKNVAEAFEGTASQEVRSMDETRLHKIPGQSLLNNNDDSFGRIIFVCIILFIIYAW